MVDQLAKKIHGVFPDSTHNSLSVEAEVVACPAKTHNQPIICHRCKIFKVLKSRTT